MIYVKIRLEGTQIFLLHIPPLHLQIEHRIYVCKVMCHVRIGEYIFVLKG
jgi:hypothetical protein